MTYLNYLFIYSIFGFLMESEVYKLGNTSKHSGIFYGPYTFVYGVGVLASILVYEKLNNYLKDKNKYLKTLIYFLIFTILLSLIEYLGGNILKLIFSIDMWDYSNHSIHFGKYVCLTNSLIWGVLATFNIYYIYPKLKKIVKKIPELYTYLTIIIFLIDLILTIYFKI